jgi:hypothetical protein
MPRTNGISNADQPLAASHWQAERQRRLAAISSAWSNLLDALKDAEGPA